MKRRTFLATAILAKPLISALAFGESEQKNIQLPLNSEGTTPLLIDERRLSFMNSLQSECDKVSQADFFTYKNAITSYLKGKTPFPALQFLDSTLEKTLIDVKNRTVKKEEIAIWHVYNMGYIFKTNQATFAIDICHKKARQLAKCIDFLLITHNHRDHYDTNLICEMGEKPVLSNFLNNKFRAAEVKTFNFGDIEITATPVDHNSVLKKFVLAFEIKIKSDSGLCSIYHVGDACNIKQLNPQRSPDIFIPHLAVGLDIKKCQTENVKPSHILVSHILELGHSIDKWRWPISLGVKTCENCKVSKAYLPLWGDTMIWDIKKKRFL